MECVAFGVRGSAAMSTVALSTVSDSSLARSARATFPSIVPTLQACPGSLFAAGVPLRSHNAQHQRAASRGKGFTTRAAAEEVGGPLSPESPSGQLLRELLQNHPHLVPSAADQQLELLAEQATTVAEGEEGKKKGDSDLVLYKRIEQIREQERQKAVEEVIYSLIVQRFIETGSPLLPKIPFVNVDPTNPMTLGLLSMVPTAPANAKVLQAVHTPEALEMVQDHLERVLGGKTGGIPGGQSAEDRVLVGTSKMRLGQVYAASIMYGYFLRRVDQRFQLEKGMRLMLGGEAAASTVGNSSTSGMDDRLEEERKARSAEFAVEDSGNTAAGSGETDKARQDLLGLGGGLGDSEKPQSALRAYVSSFDHSTLQAAVTVRSMEGISVVERHTEALFGKPEVVSMEGGVAMLKDDDAHITVSTLRRLILEAVAFGNFLWDVESYVDSRCKITK